MISSAGLAYDGSASQIPKEIASVYTKTAYQVFRIVMDEAWMLRNEIEEFLEELINKLGYPWLRCFLYKIRDRLPRIAKVLRVCAEKRAGIKVGKTVLVRNTRALHSVKKVTNNCCIGNGAGDYATNAGPQNEAIIIKSSDSD